MEQWQNFLLAEAGASAALTGLIFVGVSINLKRILSLPKLPNRALEALLLLLTILVVSSLLLVPQQSMSLAGIEVLLIGIGIWTSIIVLDLRILRGTKRQFRLQHGVNMVLSQLATLPYVVGGTIMVLNGANGLYWLVPAFIFAFLKALLDAWVLLVEINR